LRGLGADAVERRGVGGAPAVGPALGEDATSRQPTLSSIRASRPFTRARTSNSNENKSRHQRSPSFSKTCSNAAHQNNQDNPHTDPHADPTVDTQPAMGFHVVFRLEGFEREVAWRRFEWLARRGH
jgi:hypothetical protein